MYYVADNRSIQLVTTFWLPASFRLPMDFIIVQMNKDSQFFVFSFPFRSLKFSSFLIDLNTVYDSDFNFGLKLMTLRNYSDCFPLIQMTDQISCRLKLRLACFLSMSWNLRQKSQPTDKIQFLLANIFIRKKMCLSRLHADHNPWFIFLGGKFYTGNLFRFSCFFFLHKNSSQCRMKLIFSTTKLPQQYAFKWKSTTHINGWYFIGHFI